MATVTCTVTNNKASSKKEKLNYKRVNLKRKQFSSGKNSKFKRFKKTPKYIRDNPENQLAKQIENDAYHFTDSDDEDYNDLGMGLDLSDLPFLDDNDSLEKQMTRRAITQDSVRPLFLNEESYDESLLEEALVDLRYKTFRPNQKETIKRILFGRSTLFISPTGSGKSLCYQLPALLYWRQKKYITIVVSPLISLMEDQLANFPSVMKAASLHSGHSRAQKLATIRQIIENEVQVVFISPESIVSGVLDMDDLKDFPPVGLVCIDEAHCLSEWSHNFRPAYSQFYRILREQMNIKTFLGLTATATKATSFAVSRCLTINPETDVVGTTSIPDNLMLSVSCEINKLRALMELLKTTTFRHLPSIIIYCNRREDTESVASNIRINFQNMYSLIEVPERVKRTDTKGNSSGKNTGSPEKPTMKLSWLAEPYHAGLSMDTRKRVQRQFIKGELRVVVATVAFGMGINKSNIKAIIHYDMPASFENYVQEIGRAGRDGKLAQCHMFLSHEMTDVYYQQRNIYTSTTETRNIKKLINYIFEPKCVCVPRDDEVKSKLDKLNQNDQHELVSWHKTEFIGQEKSATDRDSDDDDDDDLSILCDNDKTTGNSHVRYYRKSVVRKHRSCSTHEVSFDIDKVVLDLNLKYESIMTLIIQLQQSYPQLQIQMFPPAKTMCKLICRKSPEQFKKLCGSSRLINLATIEHRKKYKNSTDGECEDPRKIIIDIVQMARRLGKSSAEVIKELKKTEWELVEKTGKFRKSQVDLKFFGNMFHMKLALDLNPDEKEEITNYLIDYMNSYERIERRKVANVYNTFKAHCLDMHQVSVRESRLDTSASLKKSLNDYFNMSPHESKVNPARSSGTFESANEANPLKADLVRRSVLAFLSVHGHEFYPGYVAKIFQGISTPRYTSADWGPNSRRFWRSHLDIDFLELKSIAAKTMAEQQLQRQCYERTAQAKESAVAPTHLSIEGQQQPQDQQPQQQS